MVSFTTDSTIDGAIHIFGSNKSILVRIFWVSLYILSIFGLVYYIRGSYVKWKLEPDIITNSQILQFEENLLFSTTICPQQFDLKIFSKLEETKQKIKEGKMHQEECSVLDVFDKWCKGENETQGSEFDTFFHYDWKKECKFDDLSQNWSEVYSILLEAQKGYKAAAITRNGTNFDFKDPFLIINRTSHKVLTPYGVCTSFDMIKKAIFKEKWMDDAYELIKEDEQIESDWSFDFDHYPPVKKVESFNLASLGSVNHSCNGNGSSYKVIIHQPDEYPTSFHDMIDVNYMTRTIVYVNLKSERSNKNLRALHPDIRKCYFEDEGNLKYFKRYSKNYCKVECIGEIHKCHPIEVPAKGEIERNFCSAKVYEEFDELKPKYRNCKCYPKCNFLQYEVTKKERDILFNKFATSVASLVFGSREVHETEKFITYTLANFIADIGGYLGLFLGCSLLSMVEIIFYIACKFLNFIRNQKEQNELPDLNEIAKGLKNLTIKVQNMQEEYNIRISNLTQDRGNFCPCHRDKLQSIDLKNDAKSLIKEIYDLHEILVKLQEEGDAQKEELHNSTRRLAKNEPNLRQSYDSALDNELLEMIANDIK